VYKDFTLGRCFVPASWIKSTTTQTYSASWALEASTRFRKLSSLLEKASRLGLASLSFRNRAVIALAGVFHFESRSSILRKVDRSADTFLRHGASSLWSIIVRLGQLTAVRSRNIIFAIADASEERSLRPMTKVFAVDPFENPTTQTAARVPIVLPVRDVATALRNQSIILGRQEQAIE
jgi:hypothetical protein